MMKKILLLMCLFLLTGCSANYNLVIDENIYHESLEITNSNYDDIYKSQIENALNASVPADINYYDPVSTHKVDGVNYYEVEKNLDDTNLGLTYKYDFYYENYQNSTILKLFDSRSELLQNNNIVSLNATADYKVFLKYPELDKLNIKISTNKKVYTHNADRVSGNDYYWVILKDDSTSKKINFSYDKYENKQDVIEEKNSKIIYIILGGILFVGCLFLFIKIKNSNK